MKITLDQLQFTFTPTSNLISFDNMLGAFEPERLLAVINTTTGKLVYASASQPSGFGGTFAMELTQILNLLMPQVIQVNLHLIFFKFFTTARPLRKTFRLQMVRRY
jgi:hypothetical protein